jgi:hypothetical protein
MQISILMLLSRPLMTLKTLGGEPWAEKKSALPSNGIDGSMNKEEGGREGWRFDDV